MRQRRPNTLKIELIIMASCLLALPTKAVSGSSRAALPMNLAACKWQASAGAHLTVAGNEMDLQVKFLPAPEPRRIQCWAPLPGNRQMVVLGFHHGAVTEIGWTFAFERESGEFRQLHSGSQEGAFAFPVPQGWKDNKRVGILIGIPGDNPGYLLLRDLRMEVAPGAVPPAPQPESPQDNQRVTPPAADFLWSKASPDLVSGYDLEWQRERGKSEVLHRTAYFRSDAQGAWPERWLTPGRYSWKVRARSLDDRPGPWSKIMHFVVTAEAGSIKPDIIPSSQRPVFLIAIEASDPGSAWERLPSDTRSRVMIRTGGSLSYIRHALAAAQREGVPIALQVNGPHDIIAGRWDRVPLALLAIWARHYTELKAFYICEQEVQGGIENPEVRSYLERLVALGSEQGRPVFWADANWGRNIWLDVEANARFSQFLRAHRGYLYPLWKMNGGFEPYLVPAGLLGLWLSQTAAAWGVQPETYYWTEAGFGTLGIQRDYKEGMRQDAPPVLFQELALLGASAGSEIYSFEPGSDLVGPGSDRNLQDILVPLIRMLSGSVVPTQREVKAAVSEERALAPTDLIFRKHYTPPMRALFSRTLGIGYPFEMVPESGACYWIPFAPKPLIAGGEGSLRRTGADPGLSNTCLPPVPGKAAVFKVGDTAFIFNSRVNWPGEERFSLRFAGTQVDGRLGVNGWIVVSAERGGEARLWFSARPGAWLVMKFSRRLLWRNKLSTVKSQAWSGPTSEVTFDAVKTPWDILLRQPRP
jgi:hypothetical protein